MVFIFLLALGTAQESLANNTCKVPVTADCAAALEAYTECYRPKKAIEKERFCKLFNQMVEKAVAKGFEEVILPRVLGQCFEQIVDRNLDGFLNVLDQNMAILEEDVVNPLFKRHHNCQDILCFADDPLKPIKDLPEAVNLIEKKLVTVPKDQGECNAGWAFTSISALENALLRDGSRRKIRKPFWARQAKWGSLDLSEQFFLSNTRGYNSYCDTGDFSTALNYMQKIRETIETEANFPYDPDAHEDRFHKLLNLKYKIDRKQRYRPFRVAPTKMKTWQKTPIVKLYYDTYEPMGPPDIDKVKQYLARGIQVAVTMYVDENGPMVTAQGKEVLQQECKRYQKNHQVSIIGYDKMNVTKGNETELTDVWIVKNSWGTSWGDGGLFYVPIGHNDFCMEHYALAILPKGYNIESLQATLVTLKSEDQEENKNIFGWYMVIAGLVALNVASIGFCVAAKYKRRHRANQQEALIS